MRKYTALVEGAFFIALSVILTRFLSLKISVLGVEGVRLGFGTLPIILAGLRSGVWQGAKVGALADIMGYILSPGGPYMPVFTLTSAMNGAAPPLLLGKKENYSPLKMIMAVSIVHFVMSIIVVPYLLFLIFGIPFSLIVIPRLVSFLLNVFAMNVVILYLYRRTNLLLNKEVVFR